MQREEGSAAGHPEQLGSCCAAANAPGLSSEPAAQVVIKFLQVMQQHNYIGDFELIDDHRAGKIVVELNGRINKCGCIRCAAVTGPPPRDPEAVWAETHPGAPPQPALRHRPRRDRVLGRPRAAVASGACPEAQQRAFPRSGF